MDTNTETFEKVGSKYCSKEVLPVINDTHYRIYNESGEKVINASVVCPNTDWW